MIKRRKFPQPPRVYESPLKRYQRDEEDRAQAEKAKATAPLSFPELKPVPRRWSLLLTGPQNGLVGRDGYDFGYGAGSEKQEKYEVVNVVEEVAGARSIVAVKMTVDDVLSAGGFVFESTGGVTFSSMDMLNAAIDAAIKAWEA